MDALLEPTPGQDAEEVFGQVNPGGMRGSIVEVDLGELSEPALGIGAFMNVQVVQDDMELTVEAVSGHEVHESQEQEINRGSSFDFGQNLVRYAGYCPRTLSNVVGRGWLGEDFSLQKNFPIIEKLQPQFRSEFYNIFNRHKFADPKYKH